MSAVWRCRVCEGINQGGRVCATCGAVVPVGEPVRAAVRTRLPSATPPEVPPAVPPTPRRRDVRDLPPLEDLLLTDTFDLFGPGPRGRISVAPMGGGCLGPGLGCLVPMAPRRRRRSIWL